MSRSSAGGLGPAGGVGLEGQILAWLAAHSLGQEQLPESWVSSGLVTAVGAQTAREIDDIAALTAAGGHLLIQSKKGMKLDRVPSSPLAKALRQVVGQYLRGIPDTSGGALRPVDPARDRLLIVTDGSAPAAVRDGLVSAVDQLAALPPELPFTDIQGDQGVMAARDVVLEHLRRELGEQHGGEPAEQALRGLLAVLRVRVLYLDEGGPDRDTSGQLLKRVLADDSQADAAWKALEVRCQELARNRTYWARRHHLAEGLEHDGFVLGPDPRNAGDVRVLREANQTRVAMLRDEAQIPAPEGTVRLPRAIEPLLADFAGNLALVGGAGTGKTAVALQAAHTLMQAGEDVLFMTGDALAATAEAARAELGIDADLGDVLLAWRGKGPATLIIDGLDITRLSEPSRWLLDLVRDLAGSRWRVLATVRSYSLRYGPRWQEAFRGNPIDPSRQDPALARVRHLLVGDLTDDELAPLRDVSPLIAGLLTSGPPTLARLLHNPFNLKIAADLISDNPATSLDSIRSQHDLLSAYWDRRVTGTPDHYARHRALATLTEQMLADRRPRVADPTVVLEAGLLPALSGLLDDDVLREDPKDAWSAAVSVGYSHPVLFDYAVAQLVLGRAGQPMHLLIELADDPDLAVIARPSLDFHLAAIWHSDPSRETFWSLAIRLDAGERGHALASLAAAATCLHEGLSPGDLGPLAEACERRGPMTAQANDARRLLAQVAGVMLTRDIPQVRRRDAVPVVAAVAARLAARAEASGDVDLARLVTVVLHRLKAAEEADPPPMATADRNSAAAAAMRIALADPAGPGREDLAGRTAAHVTDAIINDPATYGALASQLTDRATMDAWNVTAIWALLWKLPAIVQAAPVQARRLALAVWNFEVASDGPAHIGSSQIMSMTTTKSAEVDQARWEIGNQFPTWLQAAPVQAVDVYLELLAITAPPWPSRHAAGGHPAVRRSESLLSGAGRTLQEMTTALAGYLRTIAAGPADAPGADLLPLLLDSLAAELTHQDAWNILLAAAAENPAGFGVTFVPLLEQGQLLEHPGTFARAAALVKAISPILDDGAHGRLERRILTVRNCLDPANNEQAQALADQLLGCLDPARIQEDGARQRLAELHAAGGPPEAPQPPEGGFPFRRLDFETPLGQATAAADEDIPLLDAISVVSADLQKRGSGQGRDEARAALRASFPVLVTEFGRRYPEAPTTQDARGIYDNARGYLCAAADELAQDRQVTPDTELGIQVLNALLQALPPDPASTPEPAP
jgi:hypothetical protein